MKARIFIAVAACLCCFGTANAQWVVTDPTNLAQGIINSAKQIVQTSTTASNIINNFKETQKIFQQGKEYYDALKKVSDIVKGGKKVQKSIVMVGEISEMYVTNFQKMISDKNYAPQGLTAIAFGYAKLLEESADVLQELKNVVNINGRSMSDAERLGLIDRA